MNRMSKERVEFLKKQYPAGTRVECISMNDPFAVFEGEQGTVVVVDDIGTIHVKWDNGRRLGLVPGEDSFRVL